MVLASIPQFVFFSLLASLGALALAAKSWHWVVDFSRASVSDDGSHLVIRDAHPDYVNAALAMGAERLPAGSKKPTS